MSDVVTACMWWVCMQCCLAPLSLLLKEFKYWNEQSSCSCIGLLAVLVHFCIIMEIESTLKMTRSDPQIIEIFRSGMGVGLGGITGNHWCVDSINFHSSAGLSVGRKSSLLSMLACVYGWRGTVFKAVSSVIIHVNKDLNFSRLVCWEKTLHLQGL